MPSVFDDENNEDIELVASLLQTDDTTPSDGNAPQVSTMDNDDVLDSSCYDETEQLTTTPSRHHHDVGPAAPSAASCRHARRLLYLSHAFCQFAEFAWQFSLTIFLAAVTDYKSLVLVSTYGFVTQLAVVVACPKLGTWMDDGSTNRLRAARLLIGLENVSVWITTFCCFLLLSATSPPETTAGLLTNASETDANGHSSTYSFPSSYDNIDSIYSTSKPLSLIILIHLFGSAVQVLDQAFMVAIERDWVVEMCRAAAAATHNGHEVGTSNKSFSYHLEEMNVTMKQIDLSCKVVGPALAGLLLPLISSSSHSTARGLEWGCLLVGIMNTLSLIVEYICTAKIYSLVPSLAKKEQHEVSSAVPKSSATKPGSHFCSGGELRLYMQQSVALQGLSLALLYSNGLTFGNGILTAYLLYRGIGLPVIGVVRGAASAIGFLGTFAYFFMAKRLGLDSTGLWSIGFEAFSLGLAFCSVLSRGNGSPTSLVLLIAGVSASRIGLWVFDIAVTQIQQESISDGVRVRVGTVQSSMNAFFTLVSFSIGFLFPDPAQFHVYVASAFISVVLATVVFGCGMRPERDQR